MIKDIISDPSNVLSPAAQKAVNTFVRYLNKHAKNKIKKQNQPPSHRVLMFAHQLKVDAEEAQFRNGADWFKVYGKKGRAKVIFPTTQKSHNKYSPPTFEEKEEIIEQLKNSPKALALAKKMIIRK
jgi:hypothetical protein